MRKHQQQPPPSHGQPDARTPASPPPVPLPSAVFRRRAWSDFQRALDPLAPPKPLPPARP